MAAPRIPAIPPLQSGDHLTRAEFERRYEAMPHVKKVELIEGVVYMPSPVRFVQHGNPHAILIGWLFTWCVQTPGVEPGSNATVRLDEENEPQPDLCMFLRPALGGQARLDEDGYIDGAPEFVAEVAASTVSIDLHAKLRAYRRNRVREYLVWRVEDEAIDSFVLRNDQYERLAPTPTGHYESEVFPGLWLDAAALVRRDIAQVLQVLQQGLASPEHAAFVARLQQAAARQPGAPGQ